MSRNLIVNRRPAPLRCTGHEISDLAYATLEQPAGLAGDQAWLLAHAVADLQAEHERLQTELLAMKTERDAALDAIEAFRASLIAPFNPPLSARDVLEASK